MLVVYAMETSGSEYDWCPYGMASDRMLDVWYSSHPWSGLVWSGLVLDEDG